MKNIFNLQILPTIVTLSSAVLIVSCSDSNSKSDVVDLGLSVKWATTNLGANNPEEYGNYYAWGATESQTTYSWENYVYGDGSANKLTKYCTNAEFGENSYADTLLVLAKSDDIASTTLGGSWRLPTREEWQELFANTTYKLTEVNGVKGYIFTSTKQGFTEKSIFLPFAGRMEGENVFDEGTWGLYWSSTVTDNPAGAYYFNVNEDKDLNGVGMIYRFYGLSVRPICD